MSYYDDISAGYDELHGEEQRKKFRLIAGELAVAKDMRLLDVGAGTGLSKEYFECQWTGIEPSEGMVEQAHCSILLGKAEELPFDDATFDVVICVTALHNFDDPEKGLREMLRVGHGRFVVTILRSANNAKELQVLIRQLFSVVKEVAEDKDDVFFCVAHAKS